jgi:hypothetical protein
MDYIIAILLIAIFLFLSGVHIYWALGGKWASDVAIPTSGSNKKLFTPGPIATIGVAVGLLIFAIMTYIKVLYIGSNEGMIISSVKDLGMWIIVLIFLIRAIGDFNYVGFFKKQKKTIFGKADTKFYTPLCLTIAILAFILIK